MPIYKFAEHINGKRITIYAVNYHHLVMVFLLLLVTILEYTCITQTSVHVDRGKNNNRVCARIVVTRTCYERFGKWTRVFLCKVHERIWLWSVTFKNVSRRNRLWSNSTELTNLVPVHFFFLFLYAFIKQTRRDEEWSVRFGSIRVFSVKSIF